MNGLSTYEALRTKVQRVLAEGKQRAARAVEHELLATYWEAGKEIHGHLLVHKEQAHYGEQTIARLAADVGLARQRLYDVLKFYRLFPKVQSLGLLGWGHYHLTFSLPSAEERTYYLREAERHRWTTRELRAEIKAGAYHAETATSIPISGRPEPTRGRLFTYRVNEIAGNTAFLDLGFTFDHDVPLDAIEGTVKADDIVTSVQDTKVDRGYSVLTSSYGKDALFTYRANAIRVVDGDTLRVRVDLGFHAHARPTIRLRGINTPEMRDAGGPEAKKFVEGVLGGASCVAIRSYWRGRYGRFLADVFYSQTETDAQKVVEQGTYLNRRLVERGLAAPV